MPISVHTASSINQNPQQCAIELVTEIEQQIGDKKVDIALLFISGTHLMVPEFALEAVNERLKPATLIGCGSSAVFTEEGYEAHNGLVLWCASLNGVGTASAIQIRHESDIDVLEGASGAILFADAFHLSVNQALLSLSHLDSKIALAGAVVTGQLEDGSSALFLNNKVINYGAVGVRLDGVSFNCQLGRGTTPIGPELTVTRMEGNAIAELAGKPALETIYSTVAEINSHERHLAEDGLFIGVVIDQNKPDYEADDYIVRGVAAVDRAAGAVIISYPVHVGDVIRIHVRNPGFARTDMGALLKERVGQGQPSGALFFNCRERIDKRRPTGSCDVELARQHFKDVPFAGCYSAGELAEVGDRYFLHAFCSNIVTFQ